MALFGEPVSLILYLQLGDNRAAQVYQKLSTREYTQEA